MQFTKYHQNWSCKLLYYYFFEKEGHKVQEHVKTVVLRFFVNLVQRLLSLPLSGGGKRKPKEPENELLLCSASTLSILFLSQQIVIIKHIHYCTYSSASPAWVSSTCLMAFSCSATIWLCSACCCSNSLSHRFFLSSSFSWIIARCLSRSRFFLSADTIKN